MAVLTADRNGTYFRKLGTDTKITKYPVIASDIIYAGALVNLTSAGYARPAEDDQVNDIFVGVAAKKADNSSGANGAIDVEVLVEGKILVAMASAVQGDVGTRATVLDDQTAGTTGDGTNNVNIGMVSELEDASNVWVTFSTIGFDR